MTSGPHIIALKTFPDHRGILSVVEGCADLPFQIKRVYWIYGVPEEKTRGGHAHMHQSRMIVATSGSFIVDTDDGLSKSTFFLSNPSEGLILPPGIWSTLHTFSKDAVCMVLSSDFYDKEDYIFDYRQFKKLKSIRIRR